MSGIIGIVNLDGRPVDRRLLGRMTDAMAARGPDGLAVWLDGPVGFGHTLLRTTVESDHERQPCSLDGSVWITADARVDGRRELIDKLESYRVRGSNTSHRTHGINQCAWGASLTACGAPPPQAAASRVRARRRLKAVPARSRSSAGSSRGPQALRPAPTHDGAGLSLSVATDAELILNAYHVWGEDCVEHLLGDFAFAIWDGRTRRLFCARDHFGVKPLYYACIQHHFIFSNTLDALRLHPAIGDRLNELAIADFLLFGFHQDPTMTTFADVQRLAPAHRLTCEAGESAPRTERYWTLPADGRIRYRRSGDYVDHFRDLLRAAVGDRLRSNRVGVWMSGGLDSTSLTAAARRLLSERSGPFDLHAYTIVYDTLIPDEERSYSQAAAAALGIATSYFVADDCKPFDGWDRPEWWTPEPTAEMFLRVRLDQLRQAAPRTRVLLCGEGSDEVLWCSYLVDLVGKMRLSELAAAVARSLVFHRNRPGVGLRARLKRRLGNGFERPPYPAWLNRSFAERLKLRARWEELTGPGSLAGHPLRPEAYRRLGMPIWPPYLESSDPGVTRVPVEARYPYLDVRLVTFLLAIPPIPWCVNKHILRAAMDGMLPDVIRLRRKTALSGDPLRAHLAGGGAGFWRRFQPAAPLGTYVDGGTVGNVAESREWEDPWLDLRPFCLNHWLGQLEARRPLHEEAADECKADRRQDRERHQAGVSAS